MASPERVAKVGTELEFTTSTCPPTPAVALIGPVPAPRSTPFAVNVEAPVPPKGTVTVVPLQDPVVIFPLLITRPFIVFVVVGAVIALVDLILPVTSRVYEGDVLPMPTLALVLSR